MTPLALPAPNLDGPGLDRLVEDVLGRREFLDAEPSWLSQVRDDVRQWFLERLASLFDSGAGSVIAWVLLAGAAVLAVWLVARATRRLAPGGGVVDGPALSLHPVRRPGEWLADARTAAATGEPAEAVRCAYRAVVAALADRGAVEEVPGRTVGEYRSRLAGTSPDALERFGQVADTFELAWYARRPIDDAAVASAIGHAEAVVSGAPGTSGVRR